MRIALGVDRLLCQQDLRLKPLLEAFRSSGRKLFLATNSLWDYTHVVMNFLINQKTGSERNDQWLEYFDAVVVGMPHSLYQLIRGTNYRTQAQQGLRP